MEGSSFNEPHDPLEGGLGGNCVLLLGKEGEHGGEEVAIYIT